MWSSGSFVSAWIYSVGPSFLRVHSGSRGFTQAQISVVRLIRVRVSSFGHTYGSSGSFGIAWVHSGVLRGRRVHSGSRGFSLARQVGVGFTCVHPSGRRVR